MYFSSFRWQQNDHRSSEDSWIFDLCIRLTEEESTLRMTPTERKLSLGWTMKLKLIKPIAIVININCIFLCCCNIDVEQSRLNPWGIGVTLKVTSCAKYGLRKSSWRCWGSLVKFVSPSLKDLECRCLLCLSHSDLLSSQRRETDKAWKGTSFVFIQVSISLWWLRLRNRYNSVWWILSWEFGHLLIKSALFIMFLQGCSHVVKLITGKNTSWNRRNVLVRVQHSSVNAGKSLGERKICCVLLSPLVFQKWISEKMGENPWESPQLYLV